MRKIIAKDNSKRNKKLVVLSSILLVTIMLFSTIGYSFLSMDRGSEGESSSFIYRGFSFFENNGYFFTRIGDYDFAIRTDPRDLSSNFSKTPIKTLDNYQQVPLYYNSEHNEALAEVGSNIGQVVLRMNNEACPGEENNGTIIPLISCDVGGDLPVKDCATNNVVIIEIKDESSITQKDNCVFISGNSDEILAVTDEFVLKVLGILA